MSSQACRTAWPAGAPTAWPLMVSFGMPALLLPRLARAAACRAPPLELGPEMTDQPLDRPGRGVAQRADRMALDLAGDLLQHVDLLDPGVAAHHALHDAVHPAGALAAGRALAAAFMHVEMRQ